MNDIYVTSDEVFAHNLKEVNFVFELRLSNHEQRKNYHFRNSHFGNLSSRCIRHRRCDVMYRRFISRLASEDIQGV